MQKYFTPFTAILFALISCKNKQIFQSKTTLYEIKVANRAGLIDSTGKIVVNPQFDDIYIPYHSNNYDLIAVRLGTKIGFIDRKGEFKINPQFDIDTSGLDVVTGTEFSEGMAVVKQDKLYGYIDTTGKMVIEAQYEDCHFFQEGLASFRKNKKWGFIDKSGKVVIKPQFDQAFYFENGVAEIRMNMEGDTDYPSLAGYINKEGKIIFQPSK